MLLLWAIICLATIRQAIIVPVRFVRTTSSSISGSVLTNVEEGDMPAAFTRISVCFYVFIISVSISASTNPLARLVSQR
jgi:hypothetical protein